MHRKRIYIWMSLLLAFGLSSCNDWLDVRPETEQREDKQFATYKGFQDALTGCYMSLAGQNAYGKALTMSHIESLASFWYFTTLPTSDERLADYYLTTRDYKNDYAKTAIQSIYAALFNTIVQANMIIKHGNENNSVFPNESTRSIIVGEAYAIRACCQLDILRLFGDLPQGATIHMELPYSETTSFDEMPPYYGWDAYVKKLEADLTNAELLLKDNDPVFSHTFSSLNSPVNKILDDDYLYYRQSRLNYWAVKALQARMSLYLGQKERAYQLAMEIIEGTGADGNPVLTLSGHADIVNKGYKACPNECLWYLSKYNLKTVAKDLVGGADVQVNSSYLYTTKDRLDKMFEGQATDSHNRYRYVWNKNVRSQYSEICAAVLKYYYADDAENQMLYHQIIPMLRMSEIYLIAIETTNSLTEANELYKTYMLDRDVVLTSDAFLSLDAVKEKLPAEYRREFFAEGQMFYAYKRTHTLNMLWGTAPMAEKDYILPLPETEFNPNNLNQ